MEWLYVARQTPNVDLKVHILRSITFRPIILILLTNKDVALIYSVAIVHVWCIKILTWLRGFRVKIANFSWLHCFAIPRRDLSTKKHKSNNHRKMTRKPWSHARILIYQTWAFCDANHQEASNINCSTVFFYLWCFSAFHDQSPLLITYGFISLRFGYVDTWRKV